MIQRRTVESDGRDGDDARRGRAANRHRSGVAGDVIGDGAVVVVDNAMPVMDRLLGVRLLTTALREGLLNWLFFRNLHRGSL
jgi:hypothetical protein